MYKSAYQSLSGPSRVVSWVLRAVVAVILVQTLYFKFSGAPESVYIFKAVGQEPWGRYGSGVVELIAAILLFVPALVPVGAGLALGVISGAIMFHLTKLGIVVQDDGGLLFGLALVVWAGSAGVLWLHRRDLPIIGTKL